MKLIFRVWESCWKCSNHPSQCPGIAQCCLWPCCHCQCDHGGRQPHIHPTAQAAGPKAPGNQGLLSPRTFGREWGIYCFPFLGENTSGLTQRKEWGLWGETHGYWWKLGDTADYLGVEEMWGTAFWVHLFCFSVLAPLSHRSQGKPSMVWLLRAGASFWLKKKLINEPSTFREVVVAWDTRVTMEAVL